MDHSTQSVIDLHSTNRPYSRVGEVIMNGGEILVTAQRPNSFFPFVDLALGWSWIWTQAYRVINNNFPRQMLSTNN